MRIGEIISFGECGFLVNIVGSQDPIKTAAYVNSIAAELLTEGCWRDVTPGLDSIAARYDPVCFDHQTAHALFKKTVTGFRFRPVKSPPIKLELPVLYGSKVGPDFESVCKLTGLSSEELIELHTGQSYRVLIMGFAPGFAYMGTLDERLHTRRLDTPRQSAPAGSVGIAGAYTGIYSLRSPGGWRLIGRTPRRLFRPKDHSPFLFRSDTEVRFRPITENEYDEISRESLP